MDLHVPSLFIIPAGWVIGISSAKATVGANGGIPQWPLLCDGCAWLASFRSASGTGPAEHVFEPGAQPRDQRAAD
jgi:hypothetical protein